MAQDRNTVEWNDVIVPTAIPAFCLNLLSIFAHKTEARTVTKCHSSMYFYSQCANSNLRERDHWEDPDVDGRIILRWIFRKWEGVVGTG